MRDWKTWEVFFRSRVGLPVNEQTADAGPRFLEGRKIELADKSPREEMSEENRQDTLDFHAAKQSARGLSQITSADRFTLPQEEFKINWPGQWFWNHVR